MLHIAGFGAYHWSAHYLLLCDCSDKVVPSNSALLTPRPTPPPKKIKIKVRKYHLSCGWSGFQLVLWTFASYALTVYCPAGNDGCMVFVACDNGSKITIQMFLADALARLFMRHSHLFWGSYCTDSVKPKYIYGSMVSYKLNHAEEGTEALL